MFARCNEIPSMAPQTPKYRLFTPLKDHIFEIIMDNGVFALLEQMVHFHNIFKSIQNLNFSECFQLSINKQEMSQSPDKCPQRNWSSIRQI